MENTTIQNELKRGVFKPYYLISDLKQALAKQDPEFIFGLSQAGARRVPG